MARIFVYDGREFPDPDPNFKVEEVRQHMTNFFPELSNAETKESKRGEDTIIEFKKRVGTKGKKFQEGFRGVWSDFPLHPTACMKKVIEGYLKIVGDDDFGRHIYEVVKEFEG